MKTIDLEEMFGKFFNGLHYDDVTPELIQKFATEYAEQCCDEQIRACSRIEALKNREPYRGVHAQEVLFTPNVVTTCKTL